MTNSSVDGVFVDISTAIEYCCVYFDGHEYAKELIDGINEGDGTLSVSKGLPPFLNKALNNRKRIWKNLVYEAERHSREDNLTATDYRDNILRKSTVENGIEAEINEHYEPDFEAIRSEFNSRGLNEFKEYIDDIRIQAKYLRYEFERVSDFETCSRQSDPPWHIEESLRKKCDSDLQTQSFVDFGEWRRKNHGPMIIGTMCPAAEEIDSIKELVSELANTDPEIYTTKKCIQQVTA